MRESGHFMPQRHSPVRLMLMMYSKSELIMMQKYEKADNAYQKMLLS